jgi:hypothetical protein
MVGMEMICRSIEVSGFRNMDAITGWLNVTAVAAFSMLLLSYAILPVEKTTRHYLNVGLLISCFVLAVSFIIPLGVRPEQCYDAITAHDMHSDFSCALSGSALLLGGFATITWGFLRSLSLHVQVCWKVVPGAKFFWASIVTGLVVPAVIVGVAIPVIGLSYRIGETCLMSHEKALASYWIPLLSVAAMSALLQCVTFAYCVKVYVKSLFDDTTTSDVSSGFRSYSSSMRTVTAKQALRRIKTVVALQYRSTCIVLITLADVVFLSVIFISMDSSVHAARVDVAKARPWLLCLVVNNGDKTKCFHETRQLVRPEASVLAAYILLSLNGIWALLLLGRVSMMTGWVTWVKRRFSHSHDFVSVDARRISSQPRQYEMILSPPQTAYSAKSPDALMEDYPADKESALPGTPSIRPERTEYFGTTAPYSSPALSFSTPRPPSAGLSQGREWDPASTHAKSVRPPGYPRWKNPV